jgi:hypothetical protein
MSGYHRKCSTISNSQEALLKTTRRRTSYIQTCNNIMSYEGEHWPLNSATGGRYTQADNTNASHVTQAATHTDCTVVTAGWPVAREQTTDRPREGAGLSSQQVKIKRAREMGLSTTGMKWAGLAKDWTSVLKVVRARSYSSPVVSPPLRLLHCRLPWTTRRVPARPDGR